MKRIIFLLLIMAIVVMGSAPTQARPAPSQNSGSDDPVVHWNQVLQEMVQIPGLQPPTINTSRSFAMMHVAIFDAVNAIDRSFKPYFARVKASRGASMVAAAAQAAHDILESLYPQQRFRFETELSASLEGIPPGRAEQGIAIGKAVAEQILAWRSSDRWDAVPPPFWLPTLAGLWQPTPPAFSRAAFTHYPDVVPFAISSSSQFRPTPPPELTSAQYAIAFNEVKQIGVVNSAVRTADQTLVARLWRPLVLPRPVVISGTMSPDPRLCLAETPWLRMHVCLHF